MERSPRLGESVAQFHTPQFQLEHIVRDGVHTLILSGELDLASRPVLDGTLAHIRTWEMSKVVLDLRNLTFAGSAAIQALLEAKALFVEHGVEFSVLPGDGHARRVLEVAGVLGTLTVATDDVAVPPPGDAFANKSARRR